MEEAKYNLVKYTQEAKINLVKYTQEAKYNLVTSCISHMGNTMEGNKIQVNYLYNWFHELYTIQYRKTNCFPTLHHDVQYIRRKAECEPVPRIRVLPMVDQTGR